MPITKLSFTNVGPFDEVEFEFDEHVKVAFSGHLAPRRRPEQRRSADPVLTTELG